jgi:hypothetical protein
VVAVDRRATGSVIVVSSHEVAFINIAPRPEIAGYRLSHSQEAVDDDGSRATRQWQDDCEKCFA